MNDELKRQIEEELEQRANVLKDAKNLLIQDFNFYINTEVMSRIKQSLRDVLSKYVKTPELCISIINDAQFEQVLGNALLSSLMTGVTGGANYLGRIANPDRAIEQIRQDTYNFHAKSSKSAKAKTTSKSKLEVAKKNVIKHNTSEKSNGTKH